ncbi:MAG: TIGR01777 family oxidoreductase [Ilumatobacteraceae bacterium]
MRVIISGASGLIGTALSNELRAQGHDVVALVRRAASGPGEMRWDPARGDLSAEALAGADAVVNLAGAGIGDRRWTDEYKRELVDSRVKGTTLLAEKIAECSQRPGVLLSGSAIGFYGATDDTELTESSPAGTDFLADLCVQWEASTAAAEAAGTRVAHLRTGIVLAKEGGALKKMLPLFKLGAGGRFGKGSQWQSWISLPDEVGAIVHLLTAPVSGPVNLTGPTPVTNSQFAKTLGTVLHRPSVVPVPSFGPKLLLGGELADALLFTGQRVLPAALQSSGYSFAHPTLEQALRAVLGR